MINVLLVFRTLIDIENNAINNEHLVTSIVVRDSVMFSLHTAVMSIRTQSRVSSISTQLKELI